MNCLLLSCYQRVCWTTSLALWTLRGTCTRCRHLWRVPTFRSPSPDVRTLPVGGRHSRGLCTSSRGPLKSIMIPVFFAVYPPPIADPKKTILISFGSTLASIKNNPALKYLKFFILRDINWLTLLKYHTYKFHFVDTRDESLIKLTSF